MRRFSVIAIAAGLGLAAGLLVRLGERRLRPGRVREVDQGTDEALLETFPASDPPAAMGSLISGAPSRQPRRR